MLFMCKALSTRTQKKRKTFFCEWIYPWKDNSLLPLMGYQPLLFMIWYTLQTFFGQKERRWQFSCLLVSRQKIYKMWHCSFILVHSSIFHFVGLFFNGTKWAKLGILCSKHVLYSVDLEEKSKWEGGKINRKT